MRPCARGTGSRRPRHSVKSVRSVMPNRRAKNAGSSNKSKGVRRNDSASGHGSRFSGRKLWLFRLFAFVLAPVVFLGLLELVLRLTGFGHPSGFLLPWRQAGQRVFVPNNQSGGRFFGPRLARLPAPFSLSRPRAADSVRIFVLGESAAKGEPQPAFGLPRMLQTILSLRHPGVRFEVVNAAMTAINSHAVLPIARDCAGAGGDIWVIYMGNNEVVGPFGAGTIFGKQSPPWPLIRATLALKTTRTGQLLDSALASLRTGPLEQSEWQGMQMFLDRQVRADDPRMAAVYQHFARNLADIIRTGQRSGAGLVVSTVAVNLRDCAPFASAHRANLSDADRTNWDRLYQLGVKAEDAGNPLEAAQRFQEAAKIDADFAELRFRQGLFALASARAREAQGHFQAARDLDTLRFRCDGRLNELIRQAAANREGERVLLNQFVQEIG